MQTHSNQVGLIGTYGDDHRIALSAWQSTELDLGRSFLHSTSNIHTWREDLPEDLRDRIETIFNNTQKIKKRDYSDLLKFLAQHRHETPFEKSVLDFQIVADIATHIHCLKHRIGVSINAECLVGDTLIEFSDGTKKSIAEIYRLTFGYVPKRRGEKGTQTIESPKKIGIIKSWDDRFHEFIPGEIKDCWKKGVHTVYKITLENGQEITCTRNHKFLLRGSEWGTIAMGVFPGVEIAIALEKNISFAQVKDISYVGEEPVYDLQVSGYAHSYVANGFVVHNSARYKELQDKFLIPDDLSPVMIDAELQSQNTSTNNFLVEHRTWGQALSAYNQLGNDLYHLCCQNLRSELGQKRAKESSRYFRTYSSQVTFDMTFNMRSFAHFCKLRVNAQKEISDLAKSMIVLVKATGHFDVSLEALGLLDLIK